MICNNRSGHVDGGKHRAGEDGIPHSDRKQCVDHVDKKGGVGHSITGSPRNGIDGRQDNHRHGDEEYQVTDDGDPAIAERLMVADDLEYEEGEDEQPHDQTLDQGARSADEVIDQLNGKVDDHQSHEHGHVVLVQFEEVDLEEPFQLVDFEAFRLEYADERSDLEAFEFLEDELPFLVFGVVRWPLLVGRLPGSTPVWGWHAVRENDWRCRYHRVFRSPDDRCRFALVVDRTRHRKHRIIAHLNLKNRQIKTMAVLSISNEAG